MDRLILRWRNEHILKAADAEQFKNLAQAMLNSINNLQEYTDSTRKTILIAALQTTFKNQLTQELTNKLADELWAKAYIFQELDKDKENSGSVNSTSAISRTQETSLATMATDLQSQIVAATADLLFAHCLKTNGALWSPIPPYQDQDNPHIDLYQDIPVPDTSSSTGVNKLETQQIQQYWQTYAIQQDWENEYQALQNQLTQAIDIYHKFKTMYSDIPADLTLVQKVKSTPISAIDKQQYTMQHTASNFPNQTNNSAHENETTNTTQDNNLIGSLADSFTNHCQTYLTKMSREISHNPDRGFYTHKWKIWKRPHKHGLDCYSRDYAPEQLNKRYQQAVGQQLKRLQKSNSGRIAPETTNLQLNFGQINSSQIAPKTTTLQSNSGQIAPETPVQKLEHNTLPSKEDELVLSTEASNSTSTRNSSAQNHNSSVKIPINKTNKALRIYTGSDFSINKKQTSLNDLLSPRSHTSSPSASNYNASPKYNFILVDDNSNPQEHNLPRSATTSSRPSANLLANVSYTNSTNPHTNTAERSDTPILQYNSANPLRIASRPRCAQATNQNTYNNSPH